MYPITPLDTVDYLVIGHLTCDLTPEGPRLGGTAAYAALTARALGLRVGIVTSWNEDLPAPMLQDIPVVNLPSEHTTTFEFTSTPGGRRLKLLHLAEVLDLHIIPEVWRNATIVHLGPVAQEVQPNLVRHFSSSLIGLTPQGWLRTWDDQGFIQPTEWPEGSFVLNQAGAAVISVEDVDGDESRIEEIATYSKVLAVTEEARGARLYWHGDVRRFLAPKTQEVDPTGAGDIFAAAFFTRLYSTRDPWESARLANHLAAASITRPGLDGIPTAEEVEAGIVEVI